MLTAILPNRFLALATVSLFCLFGAQSRAGAATKVAIQPGADIVGLVASSPEGTTFVFSPGTYRLQNPIIARNGDVFLGPCATPPCAASSQAILNGSTLLTNFQHSGSYYYVTGQMQQGEVTLASTACMSGYPGCIYPEDLYFDSVPLIHVISLSDVGPGTWYFDYSTHTIYFYDNPSGHTVETSVTPAVFAPGAANNVTVKGLTIEKFAAPLMTAAVEGVGLSSGHQSIGADWVVESNEICLNHGGGVQINYGWQVLNNFIHTNGNVGVGGGMGYSGTVPSRVVIQGNEVSYNNYAYVNGNQGAGGIKVLSTRSIIIRDNYVHDNNGTGIHLDTDNYTALIDHNTVADNTLGGVGFEVSYSGTVRNNSLLRNGYIYPSGKSWLYGADLVSSTSRDVEAYCNTVEVSAQGGNGMDMLVQDRAPQNDLSIDNYYHHNAITFDGNSGYTGGGFVGDAEAAFFVNNRFDYNDYHFPDLSRKAIAWMVYDVDRWWGRDLTLNGFQAVNQELHGTADTLYTSTVPTVAITSPADQATVSGIVDIKGTASDPSSISKVQFYVDWDLQSTASGDSFSFAWNANDAKAGQHTIAAMAYSSEGVRSCYAVTLNVK